MFDFENDWNGILEKEWEEDYYQKLRTFLISEYRHTKIYPPMEHIFDTLKSVPYKNVKAVILGQDPYHNPNQAHGFSFSVLPGTPVPPSLKNIYKELHDDIDFRIPNHGYLLPWANQGVLMLNTVLTVRKNSPNSHQGKGWEKFTDKIIISLNNHPTPIVFFLWGRNAMNKKHLITNPNFLVLTASHPSPLSAYRGFFGCKHFSKANQFLESKGLLPIDWSLEDI